MSKILIVGGGAAGMMAAVTAAENGKTLGAEVHVFEKNEKLGKKVYITGKGRCNVTNACEEVEELIGSVVSNPKFLYSAFYGFTNRQTMEFFEDCGVSLKVERGNRVFPVSDHSSDIIRGLERRMKKAGVVIHLHTEVSRVLTEDGGVAGIQLSDGKVISGDCVLVATGGLSYPSTGSTGDGYRFARETGHRVTELMPSLVPLLTREAYIHQLQGLSLRNVEFSVFDGRKCLYREFGEMMFTHFGVTGPIVLSASAKVGKILQKRDLTGYVDLKPALSREQLDQRILREFEGGKNRQFKNVIGALYPASLTPIIVCLSDIDPEKPVHDITREEREKIVTLTKAFLMTLTGMGEFKEAIITKGGVSVKDVDPSTMESKKVSGLYFAGEVLDLDAVTGGYNLQVAWSTGWLSAMSALNGLRIETEQERTLCQ